MSVRKTSQPQNSLSSEVKTHSAIPIESVSPLHKKTSSVPGQIGIDRQVREIFDSMANMLVLLDRQSRIVYANPAASKLTGYLPKSLLRENIAFLYPDEMADELKRALTAAMGNGSACLDLPIKLKTGKIAPCNAILSTVKIKEEVFIKALYYHPSNFSVAKKMQQAAVEGLYRKIRLNSSELINTNENLIREISLRKKAEEALRKERDFAQGVIETAPVIVLVLDVQGRIISYNPFFENLSDIKLETAKGKYWFDVFLPIHNHKKIKNLFADVIQQNIAMSGHTNPIITSSGEQRQIEWYNRVLNDISGATIGLLCIGLDVTDKLKSQVAERDRQEELTHISRIETVSGLLTGIAHEVNQPLCAIRGYSETCLRQLKTAPADVSVLSDALSEVALQARRAGEIIHHVRDLSRKKKPSKERFCLCDMTRSITPLLKHRFNASNVDLVTDFNGVDQNCYVYADRIGIEQVMLNLMSNAIDAIESSNLKERTITITVSYEEKDFAVSVSDTANINGHGVDRYFEPFYTTKENGLGLGLSISKRIVEEHGGKLSAKVNDIGGMTFKFTLPKITERILNNG